MLQQLQKKFVLLTTVISVIVMVLIAISINVTNYISIMNSSDEILYLLVDGNLKMGQSFNNNGHFPREIAYTTRFFTARTNTNGEIVHIDTKSISSVSVDSATNYIREVLNSENNVGVIDNFRYVKSESQNGYIYYFLDIEEDLIGFKTYMQYSIYILLGAIISIFILSVLLSKRAVKPIVQSFERQKRFITNVSHEFKTPLTIIKADCDVIEIDNVSCEWTNSIKTQVSRLNTLVENMISLTKLDENNEIDKSYFSLSNAVADVSDEFTSSIKNASLRSNLNIIDDIFYSGNEALIKNLIAILIENAIKYATTSTPIEISLYTIGKKKVLSVQNMCDDIEIGKHNDWFERFYRGDKSRNSELKGYGIGLSIAKSICNLHSAKVYAESKTGKEIIITVIF